MARLAVSWRRAALPLACAASALAGALTVLPANWLLGWLPASGPVALAAADGTIWRGSAWIALGPPGARRLLPQPVQWQWRWSPLDLVVTHPWLQGPLRLRPAWGGLGLSAQSLRAPASVLAGLGAPWNTLAPQGMLELRWQALEWGGRLPAGPLAELRWRDAATALAAVNPIGSYTLRVQGDGKSGVSLTLGTDAGLLDVSGQGSAGPQGLRFNGQATFAAKAGETERAALDGLLSMLGRRSADVVTFGTGG